MNIYDIESTAFWDESDCINCYKELLKLHPNSSFYEEKVKLLQYKQDFQDLLNE